MPSYATPSTNLSTGLSTKPTRLIPDYLAKTQNYVPLSVFFAGVPEQEADPDSLFGLRMPDRKKKEPAKPKEKKSKGGSTSGAKDDKGKDDDSEGKKEKDTQGGAQGPERSQTSKPRPQASVPSQGAQQPSQAVAAGGKQEARVTMQSPQKCKLCNEPADKRIIWADGRAYMPVCSKHVKDGKRYLEKKNGKRADIVAVKTVKTMSEGLSVLLDVALRGKSVAPLDVEMTTTANVPTLPVPIGAGDGRKFLDHPDDDKRKKKKKGRRLSRRLYILLRQ